MVKITVDLPRNVLTFSMRDITDSDAPCDLRATIDVGQAGRLVGLEIELGELADSVRDWIQSSEAIGEMDAGGSTLYLRLDDGQDRHIRTVTTTIVGYRDESGKLVGFEIPRSNLDYELSFPSGNRCWISSRPDAAGALSACEWVLTAKD